MRNAEGAGPAANIPGTAGEHATTAVPVAEPRATVDDVLNRMRGQQFASAAVVAICDADALVGLLTLERLLAASPGTTMAEVMDAAPQTVAPGTDQERAAWVAVHHGEAGLAVVDAAGRFNGVIPPQRMLAVLLEEHNEDMARLSGVMQPTASARAASEERVERRLQHRLPWLLVGLLGAMLSAGIVGAFEQELERQVLLAFFVPAVVYMADAVGTQTEALIIRGLSVGVAVGRVAARELATGFIIGVPLAAIVLPVAWAIWGNVEVAIVVAIALWAACSIATVVAMALPWLFHRFGRDPAFGSGPLATVVQDLLSIVIYFAVAQLIIG